MKISDLIGSQVLSLAGARICGVVCGARFSEKLTRLKAVEVFMSDDGDCERKYLDVRRIRSVAGGTVAVTSEDVLAPDCPELSPSPVNLPAYDESGEPLGRVTDVITDDKFAVTGLVADKTYAVGDILSRSGELVVFRLPGSRTRLARKPKVPAPRAAAAPREVRVTAAPSPRYGFLLGRRLVRDVSDTSGVLVASEGDTVTRETIAEARSRGAIVRLVAGCESAASRG